MKLYIILCFIGYSSAVIYHLNDTQYDLMPDLLRLDPYEKCLREPGALYCTVTFALVSDGASPLLEMIEEYSNHTAKHLNHSTIFHGICVNQRCGDFYANTTEDPKDRIEACLNKTFWEEYQLKTKVLDTVSCNNEQRTIDYADMAVAVVLLLLLMLNIIGTFYDFVFTAGKSNDGIKFFVVFSIRRNFRRLIADPCKNTEPKSRHLKGLNGVRTITTVLVILAHSLVMSSMFVENPHYVENMYLQPICLLLANGTLVMQTFFIMSGLLMVYVGCVYIEKNECTWKLIPKILLMRWLRLTPAYAVILAFTATWIRHMGSGPLWNQMVAGESADCRDYWWWHLIYLNNYVDKSTCMLQAWYLAADMQLNCVGVVILVFCRSKASRAIVLSGLFLIGAILPALHTYFQDLNGILVLSPESARNFFIADATFNHIYKRGHTNLSAFILGMAMGYIHYHWKNYDIDLDKYKKPVYRLLYWCLFPLLLAVMYSGSIFYDDRPRFSLLFRTMYAAIVKSVFGVIMAAILLGITFKYEDVCRSILEWDGWTVPSKVTYGAYLLHVGFVRFMGGMQTTLMRTTFFSIVNNFLGLAVISFAAAYPFWLLVEAPITQLVKPLFNETAGPDKEKKDKLNNVDIRL